MPTVTHIIDQNLPVYATGNQTISGIKIFGTNNTISSGVTNSTILGGSNNIITGDVSNVFIANGSSNVIGDSGRAKPSSSYIGNGFRNVISGSGRRSVILNGELNRISSSEHILIGNGLGNVITGGSSNYSVLMNGAENSFTDTDYVFLGNGVANCIGLDRTGTADTFTKATHSSIINGSNNRIIGDFNFIGGGSFNKITGDYNRDPSCIQSFSKSNVIVGGANNKIDTASCSAILGGRYNEVSHNGATIIGDGSLNIKTSKGACTLLLSFQNGIYLESPLIEFNSRPTVLGNHIFVNGDGFPNSTLPIDSVPYARMPFGIRGLTASSSTVLITGRASIVPFYIGETIYNYKALSNRLTGAQDGGPWTIRVALYNIDNGISSPEFLESVDTTISAGIGVGVDSQQIANFTGNGSSLIPGWYTNVSWLVSGNGSLLNRFNFQWPNRPLIGGDTGINTELPGGVIGETYYFLTGLTGSFYETGSPAGIGTDMIARASGITLPWFFPYY